MGSMASPQVASFADPMLQEVTNRDDVRKTKAYMLLSFAFGFAATMALLYSPSEGDVSTSMASELWATAPGRGPVLPRTARAALQPRMFPKIGEAPSSVSFGRLSQMAPHARSGSRMVVRSEAEVEAEVKKIIAEQLSVDESKIVPEATFTGDLGADSLDAVELIMAVEEKLGVQIPEEEAEKMTTVQAVMDYAKANAK